MTRRAKIITILFLFFFTFASSSWAIEKFFISAEELEQNGIVYPFLMPINLTYTGDAFIASEKISINNDRRKLKTVLMENGKSRYIRNLRILRLSRSQKKLVGVDTIKVPVTQWVNAAVGGSKRQKEVMVLGDYGTRYVKINIDDMTSETIFSHQKGKPGFKGGPFLWGHNKDFFVTGWAYDGKQYHRGDYLLPLRPDRKGKMNFHKIRGVKLTNLFAKGNNRAVAYYYISGRQFLYNWIVPSERQSYLKLYKNGKKVDIDKGHMVSVFIGCDNKVFYSVIDKEEKGVLRHFLVDIKRGVGKKIQIGENDEPIIYPFLSTDGKILIVTKPHFKRKTLSVYIAREKEKYQHVRKFLHSIEPGAMKLSGDGKVFLYMNSKGIEVIYLD